MKQQKGTDMTILPQLDKACGLDIHKNKIVGFIASKDRSGQELKEFGTFTCERQKVKELLQANQVEHCLMESTGIYWMSLYTILTDCGIWVIVANPTHIKQIPKRKTDRKMHGGFACCLCTINTKTAMSIIRLLSQGVTDKQQPAECSLGRARKNKDNMFAYPRRNIGNTSFNAIANVVKRFRSYSATNQNAQLIN